ncbi:conserved membrane hypothetical protein [Frankia canadensis]|uniref:Transmembrane transport protein n=1 Tax=Frankia canadensis TaxID=1836972 RepID=A0A2I2KP10_9ACTN|nr:transporter [Frankia canadensis]SNQ47386.1 conserved membrane hypothetical protein [Frankia canadensis]SOU54676.1 conserved membrane hypothetical protein [Frankia canadensis]
MIWLSWRQLRTQAAVVLTALAALAITLAATRGQLSHLAASAGEGFLDAAGARRADSWLYLVTLVVVLVTPGVLGVFWGAPLVARELEAGTHRLAWTQSVTRTRWLATRLGVSTLAAAAAAGVLGQVARWWCAPIDTAVRAGHGNGGLLSQPRMSPVIFDARGLVPLGYAAFAVVLGVTVGMLVRRTVPAMALTLAVYVAVQIAVPLLVRPHLASPSHATSAITADTLHGFRGSGPPDAGGRIDALMVDVTAADAAGAWMLSSRTVDAAGKVVSPLPSTLADCLGVPDRAVGPDPVDPAAGGVRAGGLPPRGERVVAGGPAPAERQAGTREKACFAAIAQRGWQQKVTYHPDSHYWPLQGAETGLYLALTTLLAALCFWRIRRLS